MKNYQTLVTKEIRLTILDILASDNQYSANDFLLQKILKQLSHNLSIDLINTELAWLEQQHLITIEKVLETRIATINQAGIDISTGASSNPNIARPAPKN